MRSEEDLVIYCLSMLVFEVEFPLKFYLVGEDVGDGDRRKDVWLETEFLMSGDDLLQTVERELENRIYRFFMELLLPILVKFKEERMSWGYMITNEYTD
jgi:hypothetical protein